MFVSTFSGLPNYQNGPLSSSYNFLEPAFCVSAAVSPFPFAPSPSLLSCLLACLLYLFVWYVFVCVCMCGLLQKQLYFLLCLVLVALYIAMTKFLTKASQEGMDHFNLEFKREHVFFWVWATPHSIIFSNSIHLVSNFMIWFFDTVE